MFPRSGKIISALRAQLLKGLHRTPPLFILILCLFITATTSFVAQELVLREEQALFEKTIKSISSAIELRLQIYKNALIATRGLFNANNSVSLQEFQRFIHSFDLENRYPGIRGIGYSIKVPQKNKYQHLQKMKNMGFQDYQLWPMTKDPDIFSIIFLEPMDWRNKRAVGFNMFTNPIRRDAMERARDSGELAISRRVTLVQETEINTQAGFLIYIPIYKSNMPTSTVEERRAALEGFVYSPFRATDLFEQIKKEIPEIESNVAFQIYDDESDLEKDLLYSNRQNHTADSDKVQKQALMKLLIADRYWTLKVQSLGPLRPHVWHLSPLFVGFLGCIISFLIFYVFRFSKILNDSLQADLIRQKMSEDKIREAQQASEQANQAKSRFLAAITHEIRTPLGIILGFADLAMDSTELKEETRNYLQGIKRNGSLLINLIGDVLDLSKIEANKIEVEKSLIPLTDTLDDIILSLSLLAREKGLNLILKIEGSLPKMISTDPTRFRQILINLLGNAIKFTDKGEVTLTVRMISQPIIGSPMTIEFLVTDTGIGIKPEFLKNIFQPFSQGEISKGRTSRGTGLGLVLSKQLAKALDGDVELIKSEINAGSTFRFFTQCGLFTGFEIDKNISSPEIEPVGSEKKLPLMGLKILLAEDSTDNQLLINRYLTSAGAQIEFANDGLEAIAMAKSKDYDLILMDIQMPNLDGYEATQQLRKEGYNKKIIALTAHAFEEEKRRIMTGGFDKYLTKPISKSNLINEINTLLGSEIIKS